MIGKRINGSTADQLRRRLLRHRLDWSTWPDRGLCPTFDHHVWRRVFININSDLYQDHGGIIQGARGPNVNIALGRPCCFSGQELVSAATVSSSVVLTIASVELCGIESTMTLENFVEFRWRNLWPSAIYRSPVKTGRESRRV